MGRSADKTTVPHHLGRVSAWLSPLSSLQFKASLLVILLVFIVTATGLVISLRMTSETVYQSCRSQALQWAKSLASSVEPLIQEDRREDLVAAVNETLRTGGVAYVAMADAKRRVLASGEVLQGLTTGGNPSGTTRLDTEALGEPRLFREPTTGMAYVDVVVPVYAGYRTPGQTRSSRRVIGYLQLGMDISAAEAQIRWMSGQLRRLAVALLLLVAPCSLVAMRKVVGPLNELSQTARKLANGVMDARARVRAHNEIGTLAQSFNEMADRLAETQFEMLRLNAELEERVQQRTHELEDLASRDALTGLHNRRHFSEVVTREFAAAERYDTDLTCLMFDLDHFKETNDRFGHRMGDEVLILVGDSIRHELRESDVAARFGGDEFILLLPRTSASAAHHLADRIVARFLEQRDEAMPEIPATLSIGIASLRSTHARTAEALIHQADLALYAAKTAGRNRTVAATGGQ